MALPQVQGHAAQVGRWGTNQTAAFTDSSVAISNAVGDTTRIVRLYATEACHIAFGPSPTATTSDPPLAANTPEYLEVQPGVDRVAAIRVTTSGTLHVTEVA